MTQQAGKGGVGVGGLVALGIGAYIIFGHSGHGIGGSVHDATIDISTSSPNVCWSGAIGDATHDGCGDESIPVHDELGTFSSNVQNQSDAGSVTITLTVDGSVVDSSTTTAAYGIASVINH